MMKGGAACNATAAAAPLSTVRRLKVRLLGAVIGSSGMSLSNWLNCPVLSGDLESLRSAILTVLGGIRKARDPRGAAIRTAREGQHRHSRKRCDQNHAGTTRSTRARMTSTHRPPDGPDHGNRSPLGAASKARAAGGG